VKVVFLEDVANKGKAGETREIADGYARNFLIPRKLAVLANSQSANIVAAQLKKLAHRRAQTEAEMAELAKQLEGHEIILKAKSGEKEKLYGSITSTDVADELLRSTGLTIDKRKIELEEPIRELGSYEITIKLTADVVPKIKLIVVKEEEEKTEKAEEKKAKKKKEKVTDVVAEVKKVDKSEKTKEEKKEKAEKVKTKKKKEKATDAVAEVKEVDKSENTEEEKNKEGEETG